MSDVIEQGGLAITSAPPTLDMVEELERAASLAPRFMQALRTLMIQVTYPNDWHIEDDTACLSAPGAERIAQAVGGFSWEQESEPKRSELDSVEGYMWTYSMVVRWNGREAHAQGHASTRDKFLGKVRGEFRDPADINEADIKRWARHVAIGEGIKQLLGLRGLPASEMPDFGGGKRPKSVERAAPESGADEERQMRKSITDMLMTMCDGDKDAAMLALEQISSFKGKDGNAVPGVSKTSSLRGKRLAVTHDKVAQEYAKHTGGE